MSSSSLWVIDKDYKGEEKIEFRNSWLFSPVIWGVLSDKYISDLTYTPYGYKKSIMIEPSLWKELNTRINNCKCDSDRICWELSNQQVFFTKDKDVIVKCIFEFVELNSMYNVTSDGTYPLKAEHIVNRFKEIADEILKLNENETPHFVFKGTSCDDSVEWWFDKYDDTDECIKTTLNEIDQFVTEFVFIENGVITGFKSNIDYFKDVLRKDAE